MDFIIEFIGEIVIEVIVEGSLELGTSKKVPMPLRILAAILLLAFYFGIIAILLFVALAAMKTNPPLAWLFIVLAVLFAIGAAYAVVKKWREKNAK